MARSMTEAEVPKVHHSTRGFGKGKAELYDAVRPSYTPEVLAYIRRALADKKDLKIVEIASGSGKFTRSLLSHPEWNQSIAEIRCIEPNEGMRAVFAKTVTDPRVSLLDGTFDDTSTPDHWADLIIVATAIHWCLHLEAAVTEFVRILKPDGIVCFLWNLEDSTKAAWLQQIYDICLPLRDDTPSSAAGMESWRQMFDLPVYKENFSGPEETSITFTEPRTQDSIVALIMTWSSIALLPDEEKEPLKERIRDILQRGDGLVGLEGKHNVFETPFVSPIVIFRKIV